MLKGIRILDFSRLLPGPYASFILADMGAEVIKVEDTTAGDYLRDFEPKVNEDSAYYLSINRNKKSLRLNFKKPEGKEILLKMIAKADVVLESFRPGVMDAWGIGYAELKKINPGLVYCALTGYGQTGTHKDKAGHDINYLSISGIMDISGLRNGRPVMSGTQIADISGGMFGVIGILAALMRKKQTGEGSFVDTAMVDGMLSWMSFYVGQFQADGQPLQRGELILSGGLVSYNIYQTKDNRYVGLGSLEYKFWQTFCLTIDREDLVKSHLTRAIDGDPVYEEVKRIFLAKNLAEWTELLEPVDCCYTPIMNIEEVMASPYFRERNMGIQVNHPTEGELTQINLPIKFINDAGQVYSPGGETIQPAPKWGQHTAELLQAIGYSKADLDVLQTKGII